MTVLLLLMFIVVPFVELAVIIQVGQALGILPTLGLLLFISVAGAWLVKREGIAAWRRFERNVREGKAPAREVADGVMILFAGALLLTPGFVTDIFGLLLLVPPIRSVVLALFFRRFAGRMRRI